MPIVVPRLEDVSPSSLQDSDTYPHSEPHCMQTLNLRDQHTQKLNKKPSRNFASSTVAVTHSLTPLRNSIFNRTRPHPSILIEQSGSTDSCSTLLSLAALGANSISAMSWISHQGDKTKQQAGKQPQRPKLGHVCAYFLEKRFSLFPYLLT